MNTACHRGEKRKYAANSKLTEHAGVPQRLYLRFLYAKRRCAWGFLILPHTSVQRFRKCWEKPRSTEQTTALRFRDLRFCCQKSSCARRFPIFPALPELMPQTESSNNSGSIRDNIKLSRKRQRAVAGNPDNDPSLSPPHVESATTVSLRTSYRNAKQPNKATTGNAAVQYQFQSKLNQGMPSVRKEPPCKTMAYSRSSFFI